MSTSMPVVSFLIVPTTSSVSLFGHGSFSATTLVSSPSMQFFSDSQLNVANTSTKPPPAPPPAGLLATPATAFLHVMVVPTTAGGFVSASVIVPHPMIGAGVLLINTLLE